MTSDAMAITDHIRIAREFIEKSKKYLADNDLHQASEKGWGAAAHMGKAVARAQGLAYTSHPQFQIVMSEASQLAQNERIEFLAGRAEVLHINFYLHPSLLRSVVIGKDIERVEELVGLLEPLTTH